MKNLHIRIVDKVAEYQQRGGSVVCGNSDYLITFDFDAEWAWHDQKTARFVVNGTYKDVTFTGTSCSVPIITNADQLLVGLYAGDISTTTPAVIPCRRSIRCNGDPAQAFPWLQPTGLKGDNGKNNYEIAVLNGFEGTEAEWLETLVGPPGPLPEKGVDYFTAADKAEIRDAVLAMTDQSAIVQAVLAALPTYTGGTV